MTDSTNLFFLCIAMFAPRNKTKGAVVLGVDLIVVGAITLFLGVDLEAGIAGGALAIILCVGYLTTQWNRFAHQIEKIFTYRALTRTFNRKSIRGRTFVTFMALPILT